MTCNIISTGSKGNAVLLGGSLLVDCGVPFQSLSCVLPGLRLIAMTHRHGDHLNPATVRRLAFERPTVRWCCGPWLVPLLVEAGVAKSHIDVAAQGRALDYGSRYKLEPFAVPHDVPNCGWRITLGGETAVYVTDAGSLDHVKAKNCGLYLVEANHTQAEIEARCADKLARGEYAYEVRAAANHLSREQAERWLADNMGPDSRYLFLHQHDGS